MELNLLMNLFCMVENEIIDNIEFVLAANYGFIISRRYIFFSIRVLVRLRGKGEFGSHPLMKAAR